MHLKAMNEFMLHATQSGMTPQEIEFWLFNFIKVTLPIVIIVSLIYCLSLKDSM